jgi:hypothetical protein
MLSQEVIFTGTGDASADRQVLRMATEGRLRKLYQGIYTNNLDSPREAVVLRNWSSIVSHLLPEGVLSYRSAHDTKPVDGRIYLTRGGRRRTIELPGVAIEVIPGPGPVEGDIRYKQFFLASQPRWLLENMAGGRGMAERVLSDDEVEAELRRILDGRGEDRFRQLTETCRALADKLGREKEFKRLDTLTARLLKGHLASKSLGRPVGVHTGSDPNRFALFSELFSSLRKEVFPVLPAANETGMARENFAFFEAYFSNYIEGISFSISEAEEIIFHEKLVPDRVEDCSDLLGTYQAAVNAPWREHAFSTAEEFLDWLKNVQALVIRSRNAASPGEWKHQNNQAGRTKFVKPEWVEGTLREGFELIQALEDPVAQALMTMFVVAEVHPFSDGNGRTARLAMNCVLSAAGRSRIIVPTVSREEYLSSLRRMSNHAEAVPYVDAMTRLHKWGAGFDYGRSKQELLQALRMCNAFEEDHYVYCLIFP